jgi:hypothetical protein
LSGKPSVAFPVLGFAVQLGLEGDRRLSISAICGIHEMHVVAAALKHHASQQSAIAHVQTIRQLPRSKPPL